MSREAIHSDLRQAGDPHLSQENDEQTNQSSIQWKNNDLEIDGNLNINGETTFTIDGTKTTISQISQNITSIRSDINKYIKSYYITGIIMDADKPMETYNDFSTFTYVPPGDGVTEYKLLAAETNYMGIVLTQERQEGIDVIRTRCFINERTKEIPPLWYAYLYDDSNNSSPSHPDTTIWFGNRYFDEESRPQVRIMFGYPNVRSSDTDKVELIPLNQIKGLPNLSE